MDGYAPSGQPAFYAIEVTRPSTVVIEAHASGIPDVSPRIRLLDRGCRLGFEGSVESPLPRLQGRVVQRIEMPGTYFVEVMSDALAGRRFRIDAWQVWEDHAAAGLLKDGDPNTGGGEVPPPPVDEWDELRTPLPHFPQGDIPFHDWCPLAQRPELLATFTCARHLYLASPGFVTVRPLLEEGGEILQVELPEPGWLNVEGEPITVLDARGHFAALLTTESSQRLAAGLYFFHLEAGGVDLRLHVETD